jgi:hypothetical protein
MAKNVEDVQAEQTGVETVLDSVTETVEIDAGDFLEKAEEIVDELNAAQKSVIEQVKAQVRFMELREAASERAAKRALEIANETITLKAEIVEKAAAGDMAGVKKAADKVASNSTRYNREALNVDKAKQDVEAAANKIIAILQGE